MGEGGGQQRGILEFVADAALDGGGRCLGSGLATLLRLRRLARRLRLRACFAWQRWVLDVPRVVVHRTMENMRFQRTAVGQRQIIHACSPSAIEKKIIWARPIRFSNGTYTTADCTRLSVDLS